MKKLKGYVQNKAKLEGSIAEGYVAEEALTFSSHYFWDVTTKFNRLDRNVDPPPPMCQFQVFRSVQFKSLFPNKDMKEEFPNWFGSQKVNDVPSDMIDVVDEDDDIIDDEEAIPYDLADFDNEDLINVDDDGKGKRNPNLGGRGAGRQNTHDKTRNLSLKEITNTKGPVPIQFELRDKQTAMPLGDHAAHWSSYIGEVIRGVPLYYPSWLKVSKEWKAALITDIGTLFDLTPHMKPPELTEINADIQQHLKKAYNTDKAAFKAKHWVIDPTTGTYNVDKTRGRPQPLKSTRRSLTPSSWHTLLTENSFRMRTNKEMRRLEAIGTYTDDEINHLARGGKQRGHILGVGRFESGGASGSGRCRDEEEGANHQDDKDKDDDGDT
nr:hypothetical protein [Tanacetum cinerariifolium]